MPDIVLEMSKEEKEEALREWQEKNSEDPEEKMVRLAIEARSKTPVQPEPCRDIPKTIEVPVPKDWSHFGSMVTNDAGMINPGGGKELRIVPNPEYIAMLEKKAAMTQRQAPQEVEIEQNNTGTDQKSISNPQESNFLLTGSEVISFMEIQHVASLLQNIGIIISGFYQMPTGETQLIIRKG